MVAIAPAVKKTREKITMPRVPGAKRFIFSARSGLATWSRCADDEEDAEMFKGLVRDAILSVLGENVRYTIGAELHKEPGDHPWHVHAAFTRDDEDFRPVEIGKRWDICGVHPNVKPARNKAKDLRAIHQYPQKEDTDPIRNYDDFDTAFPEDDGTGIGTSFGGGSAANRIAEGWASALAAEDTASALDAIKAADPKDYVLKHQQIKRYFDEKNAPSFVHKHRMEDFNEPPMDWSRLPDRQSLFLIGGNGLGKTHFALAHFECPLFVDHIDDLKSFRRDKHDGIVFDDVGFSHLHPQALISLYDRALDRTIHVRYGTVKIPGGTKKIFCGNCESMFLPKAECGMAEIMAVESRMAKWEITDPLFNEPEVLEPASTEPNTPTE